MAKDDITYGLDNGKFFDTLLRDADQKKLSSEEVAEINLMWTEKQKNSKKYTENDYKIRKIRILHSCVRMLIKKTNNIIKCNKFLSEQDQGDIFTEIWVKMLGELDEYDPTKGTLPSTFVQSRLVHIEKKILENYEPELRKDKELIRRVTKAQEEIDRHNEDPASEDKYDRNNPEHVVKFGQQGGEPLSVLNVRKALLLKVYNAKIEMDRPTEDGDSIRDITPDRNEYANPEARQLRLDHEKELQEMFADLPAELYKFLMQVLQFGNNKDEALRMQAFSGTDSEVKKKKDSLKKNLNRDFVADAEELARSIGSDIDAFRQKALLCIKLLTDSTKYKKITKRKKRSAPGFEERNEISILSTYAQPLEDEEIIEDDEISDFQEMRSDGSIYIDLMDFTDILA